MKNQKIIALLPILVIAATGCVDRRSQEQAKETQKIVSDPSIPVLIEVAKTSTASSKLDLAGAIATSGDVSISPKVSGRLERITVREGDAVVRGQVIAVIEGTEARARLSQAQAAFAAANAQLDQALTDQGEAPNRSKVGVRVAESRLSQAKQQLLKLKNGARTEELAQAEISLARAKSDLELAEKSLKRARTLYKEGAIALADVEVAENRHDNALAAYKGALEQKALIRDFARPEDIAVAELQVKQAEEDVRNAKSNQKLDPIYLQRVEVARANLASAAEQIKLARQGVSDLTVTAPTSGKIVGRPLQVGSVVAPGTPITRVVSLDQAFYEAEVSEANVAKVVPGMEVDISIDALPTAKYTGRVSAIEPTASDTGRLFKVRIDLLQGSGALKVGMFARGRLTSEVFQDAVTIPSSAIISNGEERTVFVVQANKAVKTKIRLLTVEGDRSAVSGVVPGAKVVVKGQDQLIDGSVVRVDEQAASAAPKN